jgi:succinyl-diaminopimelate desuccinylase
MQQKGIKQENIIKEIHQNIDGDRYLDTLMSIIRIPSLSGEEAEISCWVKKRLNSIGVQNIAIDKFNNVIATFGNGKPRLFVTCHMDTMSPHPEMREPYVPRVVEDNGVKKLFGLGAASSKSCLASIIEAFTVLLSSNQTLPSIIFAGVACDLHPKIHGIKEFFSLHKIEADAALVGEPTNLRIGLGARGYAQVQINFIGEPHHAGRPDNMKNPIVSAAAFLEIALSESLPSHPLLGSATLTPIGWNFEGQRPNTPQSASILFDRRLVPNDISIDLLLNTYKEWGKSFSEDIEVQVELKRLQYPWEVNRLDPFVRSLTESVRIIKNAEPIFYQLPFSSSSGYIKNVSKINPVAFSGGDINKIGVQEHAILSTGIDAAGIIAGAIVHFSGSKSKGE